VFVLQLPFVVLFPRKEHQAMRSCQRVIPLIVLLLCFNRSARAVNVEAAQLDTRPYNVTKQGITQLPDKDLSWQVSRGTRAIGFTVDPVTDEPHIATVPGIFLTLVVSGQEKDHEPVRIELTPESARQLQGDLDRMITLKKEHPIDPERYADRFSSIAQVKNLRCATYTARYKRFQPGLLQLPVGLKIRVNGAYIGMDADGKRILEDCILLVLEDTHFQPTFWPLVAKMDLAVAEELRDKLAEASTAQ
jgi:hypothetical protein